MRFATRDQYGLKNVWETETNDQLEALMEVNNYFADLGSEQVVTTMLVLVDENYEH